MDRSNAPTFPVFRNLEIRDREWLERSLRFLPPETSEQNFTSLYMWRHNYKVQISVVGDCLCLHCAPLGENEFFFMPIGPTGVLEAAETCLALLEQQGKRPLLCKVPESAVKKYFADRTRFEVSERRDDFDYVYATEHLISLSGRSCHGQRNHICQFKHQYPDYTLEPVEPNNIDECLELEEEWFTEKLSILKERSGPSPEARAYEQALMEDERVAIKEVFAHFQELPVIGVAVRVADRIRAFSVGEFLNEDTVVVHLEKADRTFHGLGDFVGQAFSEHVGVDRCRFINREEDQGFEGLRRAKLALGPHHLEKKYAVTLV